MASLEFHPWLTNEDDVDHHLGNSDAATTQASPTAMTTATSLSAVSDEDDNVATTSSPSLVQ